MIVSKRTYTFADLLDTPDDSPIYEILGGDLVVRNVPDGSHALAIIEMILFLGAAQEAGFGYVFTAPRAVALDYPKRGEAAEDVTHPDVFFVRREREHLLGHRCMEGVPDLVVEILSPSTRAEHVRGGEKWKTYERHGLPSYWHVDTVNRTISQYAIQGKPFVPGRFGTPIVLGEGARLTCPLFPGLSTPVSRVFRNIRERP